MVVLESCLVMIPLLVFAVVGHIRTVFNNSLDFVRDLVGGQDWAYANTHGISARTRDPPPRGGGTMQAAM